MKKCILAVLALAALLSLAACGGAAPSAASSATSGGSGSAQIPNPFTSCADMDEAAKVAGFSMTLPELDGEVVYRAIEKDMIEIICTMDPGGEVRLRKSVQTGDISGDYNQYASETEVTVGDVTVTRKGADADTVSTATWQKDAYSYAITTETGLPADRVAELVADIE